MTGDLVVQMLAQGAQMFFVLLIAPLAVGVVRRVKARLMRREGAPLLLELELFEPTLFFKEKPGSEEALAEILIR